MARGGERRLFEGGDYFKYFRQREAINRGTGYSSRKYGISVYKWKLILAFFCAEQYLNFKDSFYARVNLCSIFIVLDSLPIL